MTNRFAAEQLYLRVRSASIWYYVYGITWSCVFCSGRMHSWLLCNSASQVLATALKWPCLTLMLWIYPARQVSFLSVTFSLWTGYLLKVAIKDPSLSYIPWSSAFVVIWLDGHGERKPNHTQEDWLLPHQVAYWQGSVRISRLVRQKKTSRFVVE